MVPKDLNPRDFSFLLQSPAWQDWLKPLLEDRRDSALVALSKGTGLSEGDYRYHLGRMKTYMEILRTIKEKAKKMELKPSS